MAKCRFQKKPDRFQSGPVRQSKSKDRIRFQSGPVRPSKSMDRIRFQSDPVPFGSGVQKPGPVYPVPDRIQSGSVPRTGRTGSNEPVFSFFTVGMLTFSIPGFFFFRSRLPHNKLNKLRLLLKKLIDVTLKVLETQI